MPSQIGRLLKQYAGALTILLLSGIIVIASFWWIGYDYSDFSTEYIPASKGDQLTVSWYIYQAMDNLMHRPLDLGYSPAFYPDSSPFGYTLAPYGIAVITTPIYLLVGQDLEITFNIYYLLTFVLTAWATYILIRYTVGSARWIAILFALTVAFSQFRFYHQWHMETLCAHWLILGLYALHRLIDNPRIIWAVMLALMFWLTMWTSGYLGMILLATMIIVTIYSFFANSDLFTPRLIGMAVLAGVIAVIFSLPVISFRLGNDRFSSGYPIEATRQHSVTLNTLFTGQSQIFRDVTDFDSTGEDNGFLGYTIIAAGLAGFAYRKQAFGTQDSPSSKLNRKHMVRLYSILTGAGYLFSFGPALQFDGKSLIPLPYMFLYQIPGFSGIRAPSRFLLMAVIGVAVLGAYAFSVARHRLPQKKTFVLAILFVTLCAIELIPMNQSLDNNLLKAADEVGKKSGPSAYSEMLSTDDDLIQWLKSLPDDTILFSYPFYTPGSTTIYEAYYLHQQREHGLRMINGWGSLMPSWYLTLSKFPDWIVLQQVYERGIDYLLVYNNFLSDTQQTKMTNALVNHDRNWSFSLIASFGSVDVYDLKHPDVPFGITLKFPAGSSDAGWEDAPKSATSQWMEGSTATLLLPPIRTQSDAVLEFRVLRAIHPDLFENLTLSADGIDIPLSSKVDDGGMIYTGIIPASVLEDRDTAIPLVFDTGRAMTPREAGLDSEDPRSLSLAFDWLSFYPAAEDLTVEFNTMPVGSGWTSQPHHYAGMWTSETRTTVSFALDGTDPAEITFKIAEAASAEILDSLEVRVNNHRIPLTTYRGPDTEASYVGYIDPSILSEALIDTVEFRTDSVIPVEVEGLPDKEFTIGLALDWLRIKVLDGDVVVDFDTPVVGTGWDQPERVDQLTFAWTNEKTAEITVAVPEGEASIEIVISGSLTPEILNSLTLDADGSPIELTQSSAQDAMAVFSGTIPAANISDDGLLTLTLKTNDVVSPSALGVSGDARELGVAIDRIGLQFATPE